MPPERPRCLSSSTHPNRGELTKNFIVCRNQGRKVSDRLPERFHRRSVDYEVQGWVLMLAMQPCSCRRMGMQVMMHKRPQASFKRHFFERERGRERGPKGRGVWPAPYALKKRERERDRERGPLRFMALQCAAKPGGANPAPGSPCLPRTAGARSRAGGGA